MTIRPGSSTRDDRREIAGWLMYDWALWTDEQARIMPWKIPEQ